MNPFLHSARFFTSVAHWHQLPRFANHEVAFVGRSNAGKSTLINILCQQKRQAFTSKLPGRTQLLNYFALGFTPRSAETEDPGIGFLVDLPGYGHARVGVGQQHSWNQLISRYLIERKQLVTLIVVVDIRRGLTTLDWQLLQYMGKTDKHLHVVLTKSDKLAASKARLAHKAISAELHALYPSISCQIFSALNRTGAEDLSHAVEQWIKAQPSIKPASTQLDQADAQHVDGGYVQ